MTGTDPQPPKRTKRSRQRKSRGRQHETNILRENTNKPAQDAAKTADKPEDGVNAQSVLTDSQKKSVSAAAKRKDFMTPAQFAKLKSGPKVDIFVGPPGNQFIGVEGAYKNVLTHYSAYAQEALVQRGTVVSVPHGSKVAVKWIYGYMLAGEKGPTGERFPSFNELNVRELVHLYSHATILQFHSLMNRIYGRLHQWVVQEDQTVPDHVTVQNFVRFVPALIPAVATTLANKVVEPLIGPSDWLKPYFKIAGFQSIVESAVQATLKKLISKAEWFYGQPGPARYNSWLNRTYYYREQDQAHKRKDSATAELPAPDQLTAAQVEDADKHKKRRSTRRRKRPNGHGSKVIASKSHNGLQTQDNLPQQHVSDQATSEEENNRRYRKTRQYRATKEGTVKATDDNTMTPIKRPVREPPICYNCDGRGHIARNCSQPRQKRDYKRSDQVANPKIEFCGVDSATESERIMSRNRNYRRAKSEQ